MWTDSEPKSVDFNGLVYGCQRRLVDTCASIVCILQMVKKNYNMEQTPRLFEISR